MLLDATDPGFFGFGSGPDEKVFSVEALKLQLERDFGQCDELAMDFGPMTIATEGNVCLVCRGLHHLCPGGRPAYAAGWQDEHGATQSWR